MPTSHFFNTYRSTNEQNLVENLVNESVKIHGLDFIYIARDLNNYNPILGEDDQSSYSRNWMLAGYIKDIFGYAGAGNILSKFGGLEIKDQIIVSIPTREFKNEIGEETGFTRPREGDLLWFPLHNKTFQISFVNQLEFFYPLGHLTTHECTCELFAYSGENFNTGIPEIDNLQRIADQNILNWALRTETGIPLMDEDENYLVVDNYGITNADTQDNSSDFKKPSSTDVVDWTADDPFSDFPKKRI